MDKQEAIILGVIAAILVSLAFGGGWLLESYTCKSKAEKQGLEYSWGIIQGCMVKQDNKWIDYNRLRYMD